MSSPGWTRTNNPPVQPYRTGVRLGQRAHVHAVPVGCDQLGSAQVGKKFGRKFAARSPSFPGPPLSVIRVPWDTLRRRRSCSNRIFAIAMSWNRGFDRDKDQDRLREKVGRCGHSRTQFSRGHRPRSRAATSRFGAAVFAPRRGGVSVRCLSKTAETFPPETPRAAARP